MRLDFLTKRGQAWLGPRDMQHDEEPHENEEGEVVDKKMGDHGLALGCLNRPISLDRFLDLSDLLEIQ